MDPVCGMEVDESTPYKTMYRGKVYYFCSRGRLEAFRKDRAGKVWASLNPDDYSIFPEQYRGDVEVFLANLQNMIKSGYLQDWPAMLAELKRQYGDMLKIYACPLAAAAYSIKKEDLLDIVDDIRGATSFLEEVYPGPIMVF